MGSEARAISAPHPSALPWGSRRAGGAREVGGRNRLGGEQVGVMVGVLLHDGRDPDDLVKLPRDELLHQPIQRSDPLPEFPVVDVPEMRLKPEERDLGRVLPLPGLRGLRAPGQRLGQRLHLPEGTVPDESRHAIQ